MRKILLSAALASVGFVTSSPAAAMDEYVIVGNSRDIPADEARWVVCMRWDRANDYKYVSNIRRSTYGETRGQLTWGDFVVDNYQVSNDLYGGCNVEESEKDAVWRYNLFREHDPNFPKTLVEVNWTGPIAKKDEAEAGKKGQPKAPGKAAEAPKPAGPTPAEIAAEKHRQVEARNRAAQEKYEAELAAQKQQVADYERAKEEVARKKADQKAAADQSLAQYAAQKAAHEETLRQHEAALAAHQAQVEAAKTKILADFDKRNGLGKASTDTDANMCVTRPETQLNAAFQGNTAASVTNGCGQPVDVRICLMTDKGWNCGVTYGLGSQQKWSHSSFNATGAVFSDARVSSSGRALAQPN